MVVGSAGHVGGTCCSCIVSSAVDVLGMSMVVDCHEIAHLFG